MDSNDFFTVTKKEVHALNHCPCSACAAERERRRTSQPAPTPVKIISPDAAYLLGYIAARSPHGSLAREIMLREEPAD